MICTVCNEYIGPASAHGHNGGMGNGYGGGELATVKNNIVIEKISKSKKIFAVDLIDLKEIRQAVANYIKSEGCSCCEGENHKKDAEVLGKLLKVPMYKDRSGYNFIKFAKNK